MFASFVIRTKDVVFTKVFDLDFTNTSVMGKFNGHKVKTHSDLLKPKIKKWRPIDHYNKQGDTEKPNE